MPDEALPILLLLCGDTVVVLVLVLIVKSTGIQRASWSLWLSLCVALIASYTLSIGLYLLVHADTVFAMMVGTLASFLLLSNLFDGEADYEEATPTEHEADQPENP